MSRYFSGGINHTNNNHHSQQANVDQHLHHHHHNQHNNNNSGRITPSQSPFASLMNYKPLPSTSTTTSNNTSLISDRLKLANTTATSTTTSSYPHMKSFKSMINSTTGTTTTTNRLPLSTITNTNGVSQNAQNSGYLFTSDNSELLKSNKRKRLGANEQLDSSKLNTSITTSTNTTSNNNLNNSIQQQHLFSNQEYQHLNEKNQQLEEQVRKLRIDLQNSEMDKDEFKRLHEESKKIIKENENKCESLKNRNQFLQGQVQKLTQTNTNSNVTTSHTNSISIDVNPHLLSKTVQYQTHIENTNSKISNLLKQTVTTMNNMDNTIQNTNRDYISLFVQGCVDRVIHSQNEKQLDNVKEQVTPIIEIDIPMYQQSISHLNGKLQDMETRYSELVEYHQIELNVLQSQYQQLQLKHQRDMKELMNLYKKDNTSATVMSNTISNDKVIQIAKSEYQSLQKDYENLEEKYQEDINKYCKEIDDLNNNIQQYQQLILQYDENINHLRCKYEQIQSESIEQLKRLRLARQDYSNQLNQIKTVNSSLQEQVNNFKIQIEKSQIESWTLYNTNKHLTLRLDYLINNGQYDHSQSIKSEVELMEMKYNNMLKSYNLLKNEYEQVVKTSQQTLLRYDDLLNRCKLDRSFYQEYIQYEMLPYLEVASLDPTSDRQYKSLLHYLIHSINKNILITDQYHYMYDHSPQVNTVSHQDESLSPPPTLSNDFDHDDITHTTNPNTLMMQHDDDQ